MTTFLSTRIERIKPSATLSVTNKADALKAEGKDILTLSAGEPDFPTPPNIVQATIDALHKGHTKYTAVDGILPLKKAIQQKFLRENQITYDIDEITVAVGAKHVLYNAFMTTINAGDEVIIPAPYWGSYVDMVLVCEGTPVVVSCPTLKLTPQLLEKAITPKTKWLLLNSPNNPSGATYTKDDLLALATVLRRHPHVWVMLDDIYEHVVYDDAPFYTMVQVAPDLKDRALTINGVSKAYSMTGFRIGYAGGPKPLIKAMAKLQSQSTSNPTSISQYAAIEALQGTQSFIAEFRATFQRRRDLVVGILNQAPGIQCPTPEGAFFVYAKCEDLLGKTTPQGTVLKDDIGVAAYLLDSVGVAVVPGTAFGLSPYFRISFAAGDALLEDASHRIVKALKALKD